MGGLSIDTGDNVQAFLWVNRLARDTAWLHTSMLDYAKYGLVLFAALLLVGVWIRRHADDTDLAQAAWAFLGTVIAVGINQPIVNFVHEARPYTTLHTILVLATPSTDPGFPSNHATMAGAVAVGLLLVSRKLGWVAVVAAIVIVFSRVYIAAHYPLDVVAGLILGGIVIDLGWVIARRPLVATVRWLRTLPGIAPIFATIADPPNSASDTAHPAL